MNKILIDNILFFFHYCFKFKKLECQKKIYKKIIKIKRTRRDSKC